MAQSRDVDCGNSSADVHLGARILQELWFLATRQFFWSSYRMRLFPVPSFRSVVAASTLALNLAGAALAAGPYHLETQWKVGGEGGWDYLSVDPMNHRLYVTHGTQVDVLDTDTGKVTGSITGLMGTHGVAFDETGTYGYISDGRANAVVVFDRRTLKKLQSIPAGTNPDGIAYEPVTKTIWAFNGRSNNVTVIDTNTQKVVATIALPGKPEFPAADGKGMMYDNIEDKNEIVRLDAASKTLTATWALSDCESPSGLAIDRAKGRLFPVCDGGKMAVVDTGTGKTIANPAIGEGPDAAGFDPEHQLAFSSNGDGTVSVVDASGADYKTIESVTTEKGARTMAFDPSNGKIYVVTAQFGPRPTATPDNPRPRPSIWPDSFVVLVLSR
jgi:YVTN family beta-propeller protein